MLLNTLPAGSDLCFMDMLLRVRDPTLTFPPPKQFYLLHVKVFLCGIPLWAAWGPTNATPPSSHPNLYLLVPVPPPPNCSWSVVRLANSRPPYQVMVFTAPCELCASPFASLGSCGSTAKTFPSQAVPLPRPRRQARFPTSKLCSSIPTIRRQSISRSGNPPLPPPPSQAFPQGSIQGRTSSPSVGASGASV